MTIGGTSARLPAPNDKPRAGGYGIYYHFDYVGGPRNYKWLNTNQIERTWEQMHLAYAYGAKQIWIVNVGDIKPMEYPIQFFHGLCMESRCAAGRPLARLHPALGRAAIWQRTCGRDRRNHDSVYTKFNARRKPELLSPETYSLVDYREAETVVADYNALAEKAQHIYDALPSEAKMHSINSFCIRCLPARI